VRTPSTRAAWLQAVLLVAAILCIATSVVVRTQRPFDRDTLAIQVDTLHSLAAESTLLARAAQADQLAPGFVRQHVQQLLDKVGATTDKLQSRRASSGLDGARAASIRLGTGLGDALSAWAKDASAAATVAARIDAIGQHLDRVHGRLKPGQ
jgi:hypothetical protein